MVAVRLMLPTPVRICNFTKQHQILTESSNRIQRWSGHQTSDLLNSSPNICLSSPSLCLPPGWRRRSAGANITIRCCINSEQLCFIRLFGVFFTLKWNHFPWGRISSNAKVGQKPVRETLLHQLRGVIYMLLPQLMLKLPRNWWPANS